MCVVVRFRNLRHNKGTILKESVDYIRQLQVENRRLATAETGHARLMRINWTLSRRLEVIITYIQTVYVYVTVDMLTSCVIRKLVQVNVHSTQPCDSVFVDCSINCL